MCLSSLLVTLLSMSKRLACSELDELEFIIIFEHGRLGNQFFQYLSARNAAPKAQVICIGLQSLLTSLHPSAYHSAPSKRAMLLKQFFFRLGRDRTLNLAKHKRFWSVISEIFNQQKSSIALSRGIFNKIAILDGFFQDELVWGNVSCEQFPLRFQLLKHARKWIEVNVIDHGLNPYFLHLRRGDYVRWPSSDHPAVLPFQWYEQQMNMIVKADKRAHFIVCTDDRPYAEERFGLHPLVSISRGSEVDDFFLMTQCSGGGILSASSFSWCAAWYGKQFFHRASYIAPQYWAGWRQKEWYPPAIETSWLNYRSVN